MGHAGRQRAQFGDPLGFPELFLNLVQDRDVDPRPHHIIHHSLPIDNDGVGPGDASPAAILRNPDILIFIAWLPACEAGEQGLHGVDLFRNEENVPDRLPDNLLRAVPGRLLAGPIESENPAVTVQDDHQRPRGL